eukprot:TRINITY_DN99_c1_g2_i1.p1 TRINITY_DN99_c1_g2~~TRINITY_DN99_c1_g2_i1.p1  ORF type:complete len:319 (-),score=-32.76 TRINITY_DN99_c1_g2_i1:42-998(-)
MQYKSSAQTLLKRISLGLTEVNAIVNRTTSTLATPITVLIDDLDKLLFSLCPKERSLSPTPLGDWRLLLRQRIVALQCTLARLEGQPDVNTQTITKAADLISTCLSFQRRESISLVDALSPRDLEFASSSLKTKRESSFHLRKQLIQEINYHLTTEPCCLEMLSSVMFDKELFERAGMEQKEFGKWVARAAIQSKSFLEALEYLLYLEFQSPEKETLLRSRSLASELTVFILQQEGLPFLRALVSPVVEFVCHKNKTLNDEKLLQGALDLFFNRLSHPDLACLLPESLRAVCRLIKKLAKRYAPKLQKELLGGLLFLR